MEAEFEASPWPKVGMFSAVCVGTLLGGALFVYSGLKPAPVETPTSFGRFKSADSTFQCEYPTGWNSSSAEAQGVSSSSKFSKGGARIYVESDLKGSLMSDASRSPLSGMDLPPGLANSAGLSAVVAEARKPPVVKLHEAKKEHAGVEMRLEHYEEQPPTAFQTRLGDGRVSEFTGDAGGFVGKVHGYRATILGTERAVYVWCKSPEADWPKLNKAFLRVIGSVSPAQ